MTEKIEAEVVTAPPFAFGQTVYEPWATPYSEVRIPCPVCFGQRFATVILGNGEQVPVECEMCGLGFEGPRGYVTGYTPQSGVHEVTVTALEERYPGAWQVNHWEANRFFATREEAEARRTVLEQEAAEHAQRNFEAQFRMKRKNLTWKVGYHRSCIADLKRKLEWHEARLSAIPPKKVASLAELKAVCSKEKP